MQNSLLVRKSIGIVAELLNENGFYGDHTINLKVWFSHSSQHIVAVFRSRMGLFTTLNFAGCKLVSSNRIAITTLKKSTEHWKLLSGCGFVQYIAPYCRFLVGKTNKPQKDYPAIMTSKSAYKSHCKRI